MGLYDLFKKSGDPSLAAQSVPMAGLAELYMRAQNRMNELGNMANSPLESLSSWARKPDPEGTSLLRDISSGNISDSAIESVLQQALSSGPTAMGLLKPREFYRKYYQHKLLRGDEEKTISSIKETGFKSGIGPNAMPVATVDPNNMTIMDVKFGVKKGDTVLLVPKDFIKNTPNGPKVKDGFKPQDFEIVTADKDYPDMYELYKKKVGE